MNRNVVHNVQLVLQKFEAFHTVPLARCSPFPVVSWQESICHPDLVSAVGVCEAVMAARTYVISTGAGCDTVMVGRACPVKHT